ncbi:MAG: hypothetical protein ACO3EZ_10300 [Prochlorotrichaceae cyanobacterium]
MGAFRSFLLQCFQIVQLELVTRPREGKFTNFAPLMPWAAARSFHLSGRSLGETRQFCQNFCPNSKNTYQNI